jgi:tetratricopeptide (TPR) repeat protein
VSAILEKKDRNVLPRWRDFRSTVQLGELSAAVSEREEILSSDFNIETLVDDWQNNKSLSFAGDLISAAHLSGRDDLAFEAAEYVLESGDAASPMLREMASSVLQNINPEHPQIILAENVAELDTRALIRSYRSLLVENPRNAVGWVDLSLFYAVEGLIEKARRAMDVALTLSPFNRFVLRSASRLFVHLDEPDRAHQILRKSPLSKIDPWIAAAEIAIATMMHRSPFTMKTSLDLISRGTFAPDDTTELSIAMGTQEFINGNNRLTRRHIKQSLEKPNENSLAQAKWIVRDLRGSPIEVNIQDFQVVRPFEASAWESVSQSKWLDAASSAVKWMKDQPFSSRPVQLGCFIAASILEDYDSSEKLAKLGQIANPNHHSFHISLAFAYGSTNRTREALEELTKIKGAIAGSTEVAILANRGLVAYRSGDINFGRQMYAEAVKKADELADTNSFAAALTYWAREESRTRGELTPMLLARAREAVKLSSGVGAEFILSKIESQVNAVDGIEGREALGSNV